MGEFNENSLFLSTVAFALTLITLCFLLRAFSALISKYAVKSLEDNSNDRNKYSVFCASERSLANPIRLFPWESKGILVYDGTDIHYEGEKKSGRKVKYKFPRQQVKISYVPPKFWRDGGLTWMKMEAHRQKFYFTTGKAPVEIDDNESTTGLYKLVSDL